MLQPDHIFISDNKELLQLDRIAFFLGQSYWASGRSLDIIRASIDNSICYGVYEDNMQVGFGRVVTDNATMFYVCDVFIDERYRGQGLGKRLMETIFLDDRLQGLHGILVTQDAHGLYERYGFVLDKERTLRRRAR